MDPFKKLFGGKLKYSLRLYNGVRKTFEAYANNTLANTYEYPAI